MQARKIAEVLNSQTYPGRGIIMGRNPVGNKAVIVYFIMGRSKNSRNRVFVESGITGRNIRSKAFDESLVEDPNLIIYTPVRTLDNKVIVTNGSQTDDIVRLMDDQLTFEQTLRFFDFEPDDPYFTPRISAMMRFSDERGFNYSLSIVKTADGNPDSCQRFLYHYPTPISGQGHFIHTYGPDDKRLPSFRGEPITIEIDSNIDEFTKTIWGSMNEDNKISLFVRYIDVSSGELTSRIVNKNRRVF
jgi:hypothetical protein